MLPNKTNCSWKFHKNQFLLINLNYRNQNGKLENVIKLARNYASGEFQNEDLDDEARKGGNPDQIAGRARSKVKKKFTVNLSLEVAEKLQRVSEDKGEKEVSTATSFIVKGVTDAYKDLE